ncbi:hypothetical protein V1478_005827 [Vespula squamosa]|uniref:Uncharacterized protein n=1 Tax=Vespula squamosa TaxID=30214 RepID=A0ABD2B9X3_VESSQ
MRTTENSNIKAVSVVAVASLYSDHSLVVEASSFLTSHLTAAVAAASSLATAAESAAVAPPSPLFQRIQGNTKEEASDEKNIVGLLSLHREINCSLGYGYLFFGRKKEKKTKKIRVEGDEEELKVQLRLRYKKVANKGKEKLTGGTITISNTNILETISFVEIFAETKLHGTKGTIR